MVLADEIGRLTADHGKSGSDAPVLAEGLRVFGLEQDAVAVLANDGFERQAAIGVDGVAGMGYEGTGEAALRRESQRVAVRSDYLAGVAADETPFARLTFELEDVEGVLVGLRIGGCEVGGFGLERYWAEGHCGVGSVHAHLRIVALEVGAQFGAVEREVVEAVVERQGVFGDGSDVVPASAVLGGARKRGIQFMNGDAGRKYGPSLVEERHAAGCEAGSTDQVDRVGWRAVGEARGGDAEEIGVDDVDEIAGGEAVGWVEDVGLAPADELLAGFEGELTAGVGDAEAADGEGGTLAGAVPPSQVESPFGFEMSVGACVDGSGEAEVGELVERFVAEERFAGGVGGIVGGGFGVGDGGSFKVPALGELGCEREAKEQTEGGRFHWRRAWTVNASSCMGMLYSSFSRRRMVRLLRRRSVISRVRGVQMPCTFWMSVWCRRRTGWSWMKFSYCAET